MKSVQPSVTRRRYDRVAPVYDAIEWVMEWTLYRRWRRALWATVPEGRVLEIGVGTGKNLEFHAPGHRVVGIDLSPGMLARAQRRAERIGSTAQLELADVHELPFHDCSFNTVVASFVFCSVDDAVGGLAEAHRVLVPGGSIVLLEHVLSKRRIFAWFLRLVDPIARQIWGAHVDRDTAANVERAGFSEVIVSHLLGDVFVRISGQRPATSGGDGRD